MLGSLIKFEFKATYKVFLLLYALLLFFSAVNGFFVNSSSGLLYISEQNGMDIKDIAFVTTIFIYGILIVTIVVLTIFITIQRFYKNILGNSGYLMNTLPVKPWQNIFAKLFVSTFWILCGMLVGAVSVSVFIAGDAEFSEVINGFLSFVQYIFSSFEIALLVVKLLICVILSQAANVMIIYTSISLGHLFNKHRKLAAFGAFILIMIIMNIITNSIFLANSNPFFGEEYFSQFFNDSIISDVATLAITFFVTNYILKNKLNLE